MSDQYIGEIRAISFNFAPYGWALCDGSLLQVNQYQVLYALIGNTYGGTAPTTFALPDLRGRSIISPGQGGALPTYKWAQPVGSPTTTVSVANLPLHNHAAVVSDPGHTHAVTVPAHTHNFTLPQHSHNYSIPYGSSQGGGSDVIDTQGLDNNPGTTVGPYPTASSDPNVNGITGDPNSTPSGTSGSATAGISVTTANVGGGLPITTQTPALALYYIIALNGIYPTRP